VSDLRWHAADGSGHVQATLKGLQGTCGCGYRHRLADAATAEICPGVAHTWPAGRPCVLCGAGWRVPQVVPVIEIGPGAFMKTVGMPPPRQCIYCTSLAGAPEALTAHRALMHA